MAAARTRQAWLAAALLVVLCLAVAAGLRLVAGRAGGEPPARPASGRAGAGPARPEWSRVAGGLPGAAAADDAGVVVVDAGGRVVSLAAATGQEQWSVDGGGGDGTEPPALGGGVVVVSAGRGFLGLDRARGSVRWSVDAGGAAGPAAVATGDLQPRLALLGTGGGRLLARDAATGGARWEASGAGVLTAPPSFDPRTATVVATWHEPGATVLRGFDAGTGTPRWEQRLGRASSGPLVVSGLVVVGEGDGDYHAAARAFAAADGRSVWRAELPASFEPALAPSAAGDDALLVDHFGTVSAVALADGSLRWQHQLREPVLWGGASVGPHTVAVRTEAGVVHLLDRRDGMPARRLRDDAPTALPAAIAAGPGRLYVGWRLTGARPEHVDAWSLP